MQRCIELARHGLGTAAPNPMVGSVVVYGQEIIGEGYHRRFGDVHAEVRAIESVARPALLPHSTLYVNLEPCCHHGKTPPCTDLILKTGIKQVVIGTADPFDSVAGKGIARLRSHGCQVKVGNLKQECRELNKRFFTFHQHKRPYIILKWAQTADGFIDIERMPGAANRPTWISSERLRMLVHKWRSEEQSILVGRQTALKDNPRLNVRDWQGPQPLRMVLDKDLSLPPQLMLFDNSQPTIVFNQAEEKTKGLIRYVRVPFDHRLLESVMWFLVAEGIQSVFVEGGRHLIQSLADQDLWDEARVFMGTQYFRRGVPAPTLDKAKTTSHITIGEESLFLMKR